jgi:hypothetical protein
MTCPALRWWLLTQAAAWCGLSVCITGRVGWTSPLPLFVAFSHDDTATWEAIAVLRSLPRRAAARPSDPQRQTEWTH